MRAYLTSRATPTMVRQLPETMRTRLPSAFDGLPQKRRASVSLTMATCVASGSS